MLHLFLEIFTRLEEHEFRSFVVYYCLLKYYFPLRSLMFLSLCSCYCKTKLIYREVHDKHGDCVPITF
jgi:hypothetical protein